MKKYRLSGPRAQPKGDSEMNFVIRQFQKTLLVISEFSPLALFWMARSFMIDFIMQRISLRRLPLYASEIGLTHVESERIKEFGTLKGKIGKYSVTVRPDDHTESMISVEFPERHEGLEIEFHKPRYRMKGNVEGFDSPDWRFNAVFKTRRAAGGDAEKIRNSPEFIEAAVSFYEKWIFSLAYILISEGEIYCKLKSPDRIGFFPYIRPSKLKPLVTGLVEIARLLEAALDEGKR